MGKDKGRKRKDDSKDVREALSTKDHLTHEDLQKLRAQAIKAGFKNLKTYLFHLASLDQTKAKKRRKVSGLNIHKPVLEFKTQHGEVYCGDSLSLIQSMKTSSVDLIMTSPPFGLVRKKSYGNEDADDYVEWFRPFGEQFARILKKHGSLVIDIGAAWKKGFPAKSLYHFELLIMLCREFGFHLAQDVYWWNPAKLPTPAEWVNIRRIRLKDAINYIWWLSLTPFPKANNKRVLQPYSNSMEDLLKKGYRAKLRPSGHNISNKFQRNNKGAIPPNIIALANTSSNDSYQRYCRENNNAEHPARFPITIPKFFIRMLTNKSNLVLDPFAGSCATGQAAEEEGRKWICCEMNKEYLLGAKGRFIYGGVTLNGKTKAEKAKPYTILPPLSQEIDENLVKLDPKGGEKRLKI